MTQFDVHIYMLSLSLFEILPFSGDLLGSLATWLSRHSLNGSLKRAYLKNNKTTMGKQRIDAQVVKLSLGSY